MRSLQGFANLFDLDRAERFPKGIRAALHDGWVGIAPVATFKPNAWGFYDLHGNVAEYCLASSGNLPAACRDPETDDTRDPRLGWVRGGSFDSEGRESSRAGAMLRVGSDTRTAGIGLRILIEGR